MNSNEAYSRKIEKELEIISSITFYKRLTWICIIIGILTSIFGVLMYQYCGDNHYLNEFGNYSGGAVTAIWSLAGLFLIYVAFLGQKLQLVNQQYEIELNRTSIEQNQMILEETLEEVRGQKEQMTLQTFENCFFKMMSLHLDMVINVEFGINELGHKEYISRGRNCFREIFIAFESKYNDSIRKHSNPDKENLMKSSWKIVFDKFSWFLSPYFTSLNNIFDYIDNSIINNKDKYALITIVNISGYELLLIYYYMQWMGPENEFENHNIKYNILENMPQSKLLSLK